MKNQWKMLVWIVLCFLAIEMPAQTSESWKADVKQDILWQEVTPLGNFLVATPASLSGINPENGREIWSFKQFAGLEHSKLIPIEGTPFLSITHNGSISIIEPFYGKEIFNSKAAGISAIDTSFFLYAKNGILISGKKSGSESPVMIMVSMTDGKVTWQIDEKFGRIITLEELSDEDILIVTLFYNYRINAETGKIVWKNSTSTETQELEKMGALGNAMKSFAEAAAKDMQFKLQYYRSTEGNVFYIGSEKENQSTMTTSSSTAPPTYTSSYNAYRIEDGTLLWPKPIEMQGALGQVILDPAGLIVLPKNGNRTLINMFGYTTQEGKWGKKAKGIPIKGGVYDYIGTDKGYVLITQSGDKNYINFLDQAQGILTFEEPLRISGTVVGIIPVDKGILLITTEEINIMDPVSGKFILPESIKTKPELTSKKENTIYAFDVQKKTVVSLEINDAVVQPLSSVVVVFDGKESPKRMELRDNGILLGSEQNIALIDFSGKMVYKNYFPAPREPGLKRALLYAQAVRAAYISANSYYGAAAFQSAAPKAKDPVAGAIFQGVGDAYEQIGDAAADFTKASIQQANKRFKATASGRDFFTVLTQTDKVIELIKVNKNSGQIEGRVDLGKEKNPVYAIDDVTGQIFMKSAPSVVTSYKF